jgi:hypothetical protein
MKLETQQIPSGSHLQKSQPDWRAIIDRLVDGTSSTADASCVINHCYGIALAYLRVSSSATRYLLSRLDLRIEDAAFDVIADLFARGSDSSFPVLARWWKSVPVAAKSSSEDTILAIRRLVIGAVHQRFFQMYREVDPHLAKIIRNIKLALKRHPTARRVTIGNDSWVTHRACKVPGADRPPMPHELLLPEVFDAILPRATLRDMLSAIAEVVQRQEGYRKCVTLVEAAVIVREIYQSAARLYEEPSVPDGLSSGEIASLVERALRAVCQNTLARYRRRGVLTPDEVRALESALPEVFRAIHVDGAERRENYAILKRYLPDLTSARYKEKYRTILEYLVRNAKQLIRLWLQDQVRDSAGSGTATIIQ